MNNRGETIRQYIMRQLDRRGMSGPELVELTASAFNIGRKAVNHHIRRLVADDLVQQEGTRSSPQYSLRVLLQRSAEFDLSGLEEHVVWEQFVAPNLPAVLPRVSQICAYGTQEIVNNAIEHSQGTVAAVSVAADAVSVWIKVTDDGVGIFKKIKEACNLDDERQAILELAKGKLTTDPERHSGQGIFFTSRAFDVFTIRSGHLYFVHTIADFLFDDLETETRFGTEVTMKISQRATRSLTEIFDKFASPESGDAGFTKTHIPIRLARFGSDNLVSRSQARRVLTRADRFREVILDFRDVNNIGQGFADEIFRVFHAANPAVRLMPINLSAGVRQMIEWTGFKVNDD